MTADLQHQYEVDRIVRDIRSELGRNGFSLEIRFSSEDDGAIYVADRDGDRYVFTNIAELQDFSDISGDLEIHRKEVDHGL